MSTLSPGATNARTSMFSAGTTPGVVQIHSGAISHPWRFRIQLTIASQYESVLPV